MGEDGSEAAGLLGYFRCFFSRASYAQRITLVAYFIIFFFTPLYGLPEVEEGIKTISILLILTLILVQVLSMVALFHFNRKVPKRLARAGKFSLLMITVPLIIFLISSVLAVFIHPVPYWAYRAMTSITMAVPLIMIIVILVESIISMGSSPSPRLPILLAFVAIFFIIYTFGTVYFINGLLVGIEGGPVSFPQSLYTSGLTFTSLGYYDTFPIGAGKVLALFESIMGYITIALITTILIQVVFGNRKGMGNG